jgi:hypothetical protein
MHYLQDFAEAFTILFRAYLLLVAGGVVALGAIIAIIQMFISLIRRFV